MSRGRDRPPRLELHVDISPPAPPPTLEELIERSKVVGPSASGPGPTELRRKVERLSMGDRRAFGELAPVAGLTVADTWGAVTTAFGATADAAVVTAARTIDATRAAVARVRAVSAAGGRVAIATGAPASLLTLHLVFARLVVDEGGELIDLSDFGPIRADGRTSRRLRWVGGVAVVSDGRALFDSRDGEAAREWMFAIPRPALAVADGPFAEVAWESGIEVVAFTGLDRPALAVAGSTAGRCTLVPMHTDREPRAYRPIQDLVAATAAATPGPTRPVTRAGAEALTGADCGPGAEIDLAGPPSSPGPAV